MKSVRKITHDFIQNGTMTNSKGNVNLSTLVSAVQMTIVFGRRQNVKCNVEVILTEKKQKYILIHFKYILLFKETYYNSFNFLIKPENSPKYDSTTYYDTKRWKLCWPKGWEKVQSICKQGLLWDSSCPLHEKEL